MRTFLRVFFHEILIDCQLDFLFIYFVSLHLIQINCVNLKFTQRIFQLGVLNLFLFFLTNYQILASCTWMVLFITFRAEIEKARLAVTMIFLWCHFSNLITLWAKSVITHFCHCTFNRKLGILF